MIKEKSKKGKAMDGRLVASKEDFEREVKYIATRYKIPITVVRKVMKEIGKNGKPCRSRRLIYAALRELGYEISTKAKP